MGERIKNGNLPMIEAKETQTPPSWALMERQLFDMLNAAAEEFVQRYTLPDGTLIWRKDWPGMDGSDDPYEGFMYLALLYALGGRKETLEWARRIWEGITWQWTEYGQIHREFDAYYDWMHHGEGYLYFYFLGLADPTSLKDRQRALRFARFYTGDDPEVPNYDKEKKLIRSPITGSRGPRFVMTKEDWSTHRGILDDYLAPFEDIPGVDFSTWKCPWSDDTIYPIIIKMINERMAKGDVPLNLNATSLVAHAYMYTREERLKRWVEVYYEAWAERTKRNGGIIPDNVGLSGQIGEYFDGKWWGGYYGWRWPHGFMTIIEPLVNAAMNVVVLTGDRSRLELPRSQLDRNWELGRREDGIWKVPFKRVDAGWTDFRPANPVYPIYLWTISHAEEDLQRFERIEIADFYREIDVPNVSGRNNATKKETKHFIANTVPWFFYIRGQDPTYPERILEANMRLIDLQLERMRSPFGNPESWISDNFNEGDLSSIHKWQEVCPVYFEGLYQLMMGAPMHISHGGLAHASLRYFDHDEKRPGIPEDVAALVDGIESETISLHLVNLNRFKQRNVIIQAGSFGEHHFRRVDVINKEAPIDSSREISGKWLHVRLLPGAAIKMKLHVDRYANRPSYATPWSDPSTGILLKGRVLQTERMK